MESAANHEQAAIAHDQAASEAYNRSSVESYDCGDQVLSAQSTSGTERVDLHWVPCWNVDEETAIRHRDAATAARAAAAQDRSKAAQLANIEAINCAGISQHELRHSPFAHTRSIEEIVAHRDDGEIRGVRIVFKPVPGLTPDYMRRAIACNQARFRAAGEVPTFMPEDPTLVSGAQVEVTGSPSRIVVFVRVPDDVQAAVAYARAQDLVRSQTATR